MSDLPPSRDSFPWVPKKAKSIHFIGSVLIGVSILILLILVIQTYSAIKDTRKTIKNDISKLTTDVRKMETNANLLQQIITTLDQMKQNHNVCTNPIEPTYDNGNQSQNDGDQLQFNLNVTNDKETNQSINQLLDVFTS
tara:strand:- start:64 stop:480 length:417 start_codon:yes stop_codon:yes gene_type:complete